MASDLGRLLSQSEVARRLGCTTKTVQRLREKGELAWIQVGGVKIPEAELERFIRRNLVRTKPGPTLPLVMKSFREMSTRERGRKIAADVLASGFDPRKFRWDRRPR